MKSIMQHLEEMVENIICFLEDLYFNHSSIKSKIDPNDLVSFLGRQYVFLDLGEEGKQLQARIFENYGRFYTTARILLQKNISSTNQKLAEYNEIVIDSIEQNPTWSCSVEEAFADAKEAILNELSLLNSLYDKSGEKPIFIPDTNALITNPNIEKWILSEEKDYTILITSVILSELDELKINHRNESVREKSKTLINKIKEYRRRGPLHDGVTLVRGKSALMTRATEPDFSNTLPWLKQDNNDDKLLASTIEIMREFPRSPVIIVTSDINLQNKAEFARIPYIETPEPE